MPLRSLLSVIVRLQVGSVSFCEQQSLRTATSSARSGVLLRYPIGRACRVLRSLVAVNACSGSGEAYNLVILSDSQYSCHSEGSDLEL